MKLRDYLLQEGLTQEAFGQMLTPPVSQGKVNHWLQETRRVSLAEALQVQRLTGGAVSLEDQVGKPCLVVKASVAHSPAVEKLLKQADGLSLVERRVGPAERRLAQQPLAGPEKRVALLPRRAVDRKRTDIASAEQGA